MKQIRIQNIDPTKNKGIFVYVDKSNKLMVDKRGMALVQNHPSHCDRIEVESITKYYKLKDIKIP